MLPSAERSLRQRINLDACRRSLIGATEDMPVNVRAPQCITGGAAGAAAAAVAAGEVSFAVDTDHLAGVRVRRRC